MLVLSDDLELIEAYAIRVLSKNLIFICDYSCMHELTGYHFRSIGITAYKQDHFVHTLNYEIGK